MADGVALIAFMDQPKKAALAFSNKFACPICGYSIPELEPRLFSFNNPSGACADCDGLGVRMFFDPTRIVAHPHLSLAGGAIAGWDSRSHFYWGMIKALAKHYKFDVTMPFQDLAEKHRNIVLYGSGGEKIQFKYDNEKKGNHWEWKHAFEGIIPNMQRRYTETESQAVRETLAKYQSTQTCKTCGGTRLNAAARNVFVQEKPLHEITNLSVTGRARLLPQVEPGRLARRDRRQDRQGDRQSPEVPGRRGARLPLARPQRGFALRRRGATHSAREPDRLRARRRHVHPGRTFDRPAPARQPAPARHAAEPARLGQHRARGGARPGSDHGGRLRRRSRPRRRRARRSDRGARHAEADPGERGVAHGPVPLWPTRDSAAERAASIRSQADAEDQRRARQQSEGRRRRDPRRGSSPA